MIFDNLYMREISKQFLKFGDVKIKKEKFHSSTKAFVVCNVEIKKILVSVQRFIWMSVKMKKKSQKKKRHIKEKMIRFRSDESDERY